VCLYIPVSTFEFLNQSSRLLSLELTDKLIVEWADFLLRDRKVLDSHKDSEAYARDVTPSFTSLSVPYPLIAMFV
jgi:hypothetical protein